MISFIAISIHIGVPKVYESKYRNVKLNPLPGTLNDVKALSALAEELGYDTRVYSNNMATHALVLLSHTHSLFCIE